MSSKKTSPKSSLAKNMERNPDIYVNPPINNINICIVIYLCYNLFAI